METEFNINSFIEQLRLGREMANGLGATPDAINEVSLKILNDHAPEIVDFLSRYAKLHLESDRHRLELIEQMPKEIRNWPIEADREILFAGAEVGLLKEAFDFVKKR